MGAGRWASAEPQRAAEPFPFGKSDYTRSSKRKYSVKCRKYPRRYTAINTTIILGAVRSQPRELLPLVLVASTKRADRNDPGDFY